MRMWRTFVPAHLAIHEMMLSLCAGFYAGALSSSPLGCHGVLLSLPPTSYYSTGPVSQLLLLPAPAHPPAAVTAPGGTHQSVPGSTHGGTAAMQATEAGSFADCLVSIGQEGSAALISMSSRRVVQVCRGLPCAPMCITHASINARRGYLILGGVDPTGTPMCGLFDITTGALDRMVLGPGACSLMGDPAWGQPLLAPHAVDHHSHAHGHSHASAGRQSRGSGSGSGASTPMQASSSPMQAPSPLMQAMQGGMQAGGRGSASFTSSRGGGTSASKASVLAFHISFEPLPSPSSSSAQLTAAANDVGDVGLLHVRPLAPSIPAQASHPHLVLACVDGLALASEGLPTGAGKAPTGSLPKHQLPPNSSSASSSAPAPSHKPKEASHGAAHAAPGDARGTALAWAAALACLHPWGACRDADAAAAQVLQGVLHQGSPQQQGQPPSSQPSQQLLWGAEGRLGGAGVAHGYAVSLVRDGLLGAGGAVALQPPCPADSLQRHVNLQQGREQEQGGEGKGGSPAKAVAAALSQTQACSWQPAGLWRSSGGLVADR